MRGAVTELLHGAVAAGMVAGTVAHWQRPAGECRTAVAGHATLVPQRTPAQAETLFDLASLTKPLVTATLSLLAFRRGLMEPSASLGELLPAARGRPAGECTVIQLLTHTAGLPAWVPLYAIAENDRENALNRLLEIEADRPGRILYSDVGFLLLGELLAQLFDAPLDVTFQDLIARPLGLVGELGYRPRRDRSIAGGSARPTVELELTADLGWSADTVPPADPLQPDDGNARFLGGVAGHAGLFGTAAAVATLAREFLPWHGDLLSSDEAIAATTARARDSGLVRGLGWQLAESRGSSAGPALGPCAFGHIGFTGASLWVDPECEAVLVLLANRHHPGHRGVDLHPLRRRFHTLAVRELAAS